MNGVSTTKCEHSWRSDQNTSSFCHILPSNMAHGKLQIPNDNPLTNIVKKIISDNARVSDSSLFEDLKREKYWLAVLEENAHWSNIDEQISDYI